MKMLLGASLLQESTRIIGDFFLPRPRAFSILVENFRKKWRDFFSIFTSGLFLRNDVPFIFILRLNLRLFFYVQEMKNYAKMK